MMYKRVFFLLAVLSGTCLLHSALAEPDKTAQEKRKEGSATKRDLVYVDATAANLSHPLVCGQGRDFPEGKELTFKDADTGKNIHAVFPDGKKAPENLNGKFILNGKYQPIQKLQAYKLKKPDPHYQYFVVSSWQHQEE